MFVCHYCKTSFKRKAFFCRNCSKPILNESGRQLAGWQLDHPILTDFEHTEENIFYFVKEFKNYERKDVNFYTQVNEIMKLLFIFCEKTKYKLIRISTTIEGDGQLVQPLNSEYYVHGKTLNQIEMDLKHCLEWQLIIYRETEGITIRKIEKIRVRLEKVL